MNKIIWALIIVIVIIGGVYFMLINNNVSNRNESTWINTTVKSVINNIGGIPQPPKLPE